MAQPAAWEEAVAGGRGEVARGAGSGNVWSVREQETRQNLRVSLPSQLLPMGKSFTLELFDSILPEGSKTKTKMGLRNIICSIQKEKKGWWKRLLKSEEKHPYIKVDWNKWCDEDEESEVSGDSDDDFDGGNEDGSDDDDGMLSECISYLPDLEKLRGK
ncbi:hypothetical protein U9M48_010053 [Paspalum notatum var. saurae]|uniref:Co-chaperone protein p23 n=1 Tax=Paspalum notatum var. saurae TaxID=547442 RepID=A0AAQ3SSV4_PASNO